VSICSELTLGICSAREDLLMKQLNCLADLGVLVTLVIIILDGVPEPGQLRKLLSDSNVRFLIKRHKRQRGLSHSRNTLLSICPTKYLIFMDDDTMPPANAIYEANEAFETGFDIVGARLVLPCDRCLPWFVLEGQYHYIGIHSDRNQKITTWGAFMGVNVPFVKRQKLLFDEKLGRKGSSLQSGDDTSFIRELKKRGAKEYILNRTTVTHDISIKRLTLRYLLRRAWWQGRSEVRRNSVLAGMSKEFTRNHQFIRGPLGLLLGIICFLAVAGGCLYELGRKGGRNNGY